VGWLKALNSHPSTEKKKKKKNKTKQEVYTHRALSVLLEMADPDEEVCDGGQKRNMFCSCQEQTHLTVRFLLTS
jgi:hypothetical protein